MRGSSVFLVNCSLVDSFEIADKLLLKTKNDSEFVTTPTDDMGHLNNYNENILPKYLD